MIIFDLDGTLALNDHRKHWVTEQYSLPEFQKITGKKWKPNWEKFEDECEKDLPNEPIINLWNDKVSLGMMDHLYIFSGRSKRVEKQTLEWLDKHLLCFVAKNLRMRPIGDYKPDDELKEQWLNEELVKGNEIEMVFDDRQKVVDMWRRRGITCLQVAQGDF